MLIGYREEAAILELYTFSPALLVTRVYLSRRALIDWVGVSRSLQIRKKTLCKCFNVIVYNLGGPQSICHWPLEMKP